MQNLPTLVLGITVAAYWACVGAMVIRVSRRGRRLGRVLIPAQRGERFMWLFWVPLVATWIAMPFIAPLQDQARHPWIGIPVWAGEDSLNSVLRIVAAGLAVVCLGVSIRCWRHMGKLWRMGIDPTAEKRLITDGPFARVRHPIYTVSISLMICSLVILPTPLMLVIAVLHITLMQLKARNEEAYLLETHGESYREYCRDAGRFLPRLRPSR